MAEADRYVEPGLGRYAPMQPGRYIPSEPARYTAPSPERFDAVERDKAESARARRLYIRKRLARLMHEGRDDKSGALANLQQAQALLKKAKTFKNWLTLGGALASLTIIGIIWTIVQWNIQMVWTVFGLPGKDFIGLSVWLIPVILFVDILLFFIFATIMLAAYFMANPGTAACAIAPELTKVMLGNGFLGSLGGTLIKWTCDVVSAVKGG